MKTIKHYKSRGVLLGNLWGGGTGAYPTITIGEMSLSGFKRQAKKYLDDGSLDSGMGFESLIGAILPVTVTETIKIDNKEYSRNYQGDDIVIGNLSADQLDFLMDCLNDF